jgi:hypothetical protein
MGQSIGVCALVCQARRGRIILMARGLHWKGAARGDMVRNEQKAKESLIFNGGREVGKKGVAVQLKDRIRWDCQAQSSN